MERVIVERRALEPITIEQLRQSSCAHAGCFQRFRVRHIRSLRSADGLRVLCEFEGPDAESVRRANDLAQLPYEAVWTATVFEADV